ncbi:DUF3016 domain-containing protein [Undibacterium sp. Ren11W]|uniref:DUF3016 domain-containing protein n=1 Tax=Undibacterium sp. Ren11W TaxID=3413045 RepID=UPI003BF08B9A
MKHLLITLIIAATLPVAAFAGVSKVSWQEPDKFTDVRPGNENRDAFQKRLMSDFDAIFTDLAKKLPDDYQLEVNITDLDLAGDVNAGHSMASRDIRIVKDIFSPSMRFSYRLTNSKNELVSSGQEHLRDMGFMSKTRPIVSNSSFPYEERMLRDWFDKQQKKKIFPNR